MNNRYVQQFKKGSLEMILLCLIGRKCRLAPAVANGGSKKYYSLTDKGRNILDELILFWSSYENCVNGFIESYQQARVSK